MAVEFADPIHSLLLIFKERHPDIDVRIQFGHPDEEPLSLEAGCKGVTWFPENDEEGPAIITVDGTLDRGVQGTVDILAHELAHVAVGPDHEHDEVWENEYDTYFQTFGRIGVVVRTV